MQGPANCCSRVKVHEIFTDKSHNLRPEEVHCKFIIISLQKKKYSHSEVQVKTTKNEQSLKKIYYKLKIYLGQLGVVNFKNKN